MNTTSQRRKLPERRRRLPAYYDGFELNAIEISNTQTGVKQLPKGHKLQINKWMMLVLSIFFLLFSNCTANEIVTAETNLGDLFSTAQVCGLSGHHATYVVLPKELKCDFRDPRSKTVEDVLITLFFVKSLSDTITAYICQIEMNKISTYYGFFGSKAVLERQMQYAAYSIKTCQIKAFELQIGKSSLTEIYRDVFTNDTTQFQPEYFWCCSMKQ